MDTQNARPTSEFKTSGGHTIIYYTYINKLEERQITEIYLKSMDEVKAGNPTGRAKFQADDKAMELVIKSLDGSTENVVNRILELPTGEYNEITAIIEEVVEPKKK